MPSGLPAGLYTFTFFLCEAGSPASTEAAVCGSFPRGRRHQLVGVGGGHTRRRSHGSPDRHGNLPTLVSSTDFQLNGSIGIGLANLLNRIAAATTIAAAFPFGSPGGVPIVMRNTDRKTAEGVPLDFPAPSTLDISGASSFVLNIDEGDLQITGGTYVTYGGKQYARFQPTRTQTRALQASILHQYAVVGTWANEDEVGVVFGPLQRVSAQDGS